MSRCDGIEGVLELSTPEVSRVGQFRAKIIVDEVAVGLPCDERLVVGDRFNGHA